MVGTITFRPIEANLTHNTDIIGKMNPYCAFIVGDSVFKGQICKKGGKHPVWEEAVTVPVTNANEVIVEVMDKDRLTKDDHIGSFLLNLNESRTAGHSSRWYPLTYKNKPAGELLLEVSFSGMGNTGINQAGLVGQQAGFVQQQNIVQQEVIVEQPVVVEKEIVRETVLPPQDRHLYTEQQQVVENRTFLKEVDVVETRAHQQTIEVLEPTRVMKEVQYTQAVPVTKTIEVNEPQVVRKEVEVIEPRLVTKTIQVIENVPVMKQVEVIESVPRMQEVQTFEQQTFTKQVEVTDYVPVQRQVTVTEPVHLKKTVEYVEPVITTKTITKEMRQPVIVDEQITTTVGPASLIAESESYITEFSRLNISQEQRLFRFNEWRRLREGGYNDQRLEEHWTTQGWGPVHTYRFNEYTQHGGKWGLFDQQHHSHSHSHHHQSGLSTHSSQYGGSQYGDSSMSSQYGAQQVGSQYGAQQVGSQYGAQQVGSQYGAQQVGNQYGAQQVGNQYGAQQVGNQLAGSQLPGTQQNNLQNRF